MTQVFVDNKVTPVTIVDASNTFVSRQLKDAEGKITHIEIGKDVKRKPVNVEKGIYKEVKGVPQFKKVVKLKTENDVREVNADINVADFVEGDLVDIIGVSKGKGFAGVMKRWNFKGGKRTRGQSDRERAPGSIASGQTMGRVLKGTKMGGRMGRDNMTIKRLKVAFIDTENNLIGITGSIPGTNGRSYVLIKESFYNTLKK